MTDNKTKLVPDDEQARLDGGEYEYQFIINEHLRRTAKVSSFVFAADRRGIRYNLRTLHSCMLTFEKLLSPYADSTYIGEMKEKNTALGGLNPKLNPNEFYACLLDQLESGVKLMARRDMLLTKTQTLTI